MPKVLLFDIETFPNESYTWSGKYEQNVIAFKKEWSIASFAWKWLGEKTCRCIARIDFKDETDKEVCKALWKLFKEADVLIAHNGNSFDLKKVNARFLFHGLSPPKIPQTIDTKLVAKRYFGLNSNSLDDIGNYLGVGRKIKHQGFDLWLGCMAGDKKCWLDMKRYNIQDVVLLSRVYKKLLPWIQNHPNMYLLGNISGRHGCPNCGSDHIMKDGTRANQKTLNQQWRCLDCLSYHQTPIKRAK